MINRLLPAFVFMALLSGCGWDGTATRSNDFTPLTSIEIVAESPTIAVHTSTRLTAIGNYSGQFSRDITSQVVWTSVSQAVTVNAPVPNRVSGQAEGTAVLTATVGTVTANFTLTVSPATVSSLTISPLNPSLAKGLSRQFSVSGRFSDATTQDLTFDVDWVSSDPTVATFSNDPVSRGLAKALVEGKTTLSATFAFNGVSVSDTTLLTVTAPALQAITVTPTNPTILSISKTGFKAVGSYSDGSSADITAQALWSSADTAVATITTGGIAKTLTPGTVALTATLAGISGTANVKVTGGILTAITVAPINPRLVKNTTARISARGSFKNGSSRDITGAVDWTVDNAFATVSLSGGNLVLLNPIAATAGTILKAKSGAVFTDTTLTVIDPFLLSISIAPMVMDLTTGTSEHLSVSALFRDGTIQDVTLAPGTVWTTDAAATATVGKSGIDKGRVSGLGAGKANISATYGGLTTDKSAITVTNRILQNLTITGTTTAAIGNQLTLTATASYTDGTNEDVTDRTAWSIDKINIATLADPVNQPGQIVMVDGGPATLTATFENLTKTVPLTSQGL